MSASIEHIISLFDSISLKEMDNVALMKRTDTKFVISISDLKRLLQLIKNDYRILEIDDNRVMSYESLYFDTPKTSFFTDHHNSRSNRTKVRIRKYVESNMYFFEIKQKDNKGKTNKSRIPIEDFETKLSDQTSTFFEKTTDMNVALKPSIWNNFNRITLVNKTALERVTIDLNLAFKMNDEQKGFDDLVIIEVKQSKFNRHTSAVKALKSIGHHPYSLSKYCIGMVSLFNHLKYNTFKQKLIKINKLTN